MRSEECEIKVSPAAMIFLFCRGDLWSPVYLISDFVI